MKKIITIEGMSCGHCTGSVEKALNAIPGVKDVQVDLSTKSATVEAESTVSDDTLQNAVNKIGFQATSVK